MAAEIFTAISALRIILNTETDADSPLNQTLLNAIRVAFESLLLILLGTGFDGTVTAISTTTITHEDAAQGVNAHAGRTTIMTSGDAKGNFYTIDSNAAQTLVHTGDDLEADGVAIDDTFVVLYDIKTHTGHTHDAVDAARIDLADDSVDSEHYVADSIDTEHYASASVDKTALGVDCVGTSELDTTTGSITNVNGDASYDTLPGGLYGFYPQVKTGAAAVSEADVQIMLSGGTTSYVTGVYTDTSGSGAGWDVYVQQTYVTASGDTHWIFVLKDKATGETKTIWQAPDHPCYGNRGLEHPFLNYDPIKHEIIVLNPTYTDVEKIRAGCIPKRGGGYMTIQDVKNEMAEDLLLPSRDFSESFLELFEIDELNEATWPQQPICVGLPRVYKGKIVDWRLMPNIDASGNRYKIDSIKTVLPKPAYITPLQYKLKPIKAI